MTKTVLFGELVRARGYATAEQVLECLDLQARLARAGKAQIPLGLLMVMKGCIRSGQLEEILESEGIVFFGDLLRVRGKATAEQVLECLSIQRRDAALGRAHRTIGGIMVDRGYFTEEELAEVMGHGLAGPKPKDAGGGKGDLE